MLFSLEPPKDPAAAAAAAAAAAVVANNPRFAPPSRPKLGAGALEFGTRFSKALTHRVCAVSGSIDGAMGIFLPVEEKLYRRLALLQQLLCTTVHTCCHLSPQEYRLFRSRRVRTERKKGLLDGALLWQFVNLGSALQDDLAAAMGVTTDLVLESLQDADIVTGFF